MSHKSENCVPLQIENLSINTIEDIEKLDSSTPAVWLFVLPCGPLSTDIKLADFMEHLRGFLKNAHENSVICFLTNAPAAADILTNIQNSLRYQLWISIKYEKPLLRKGT